MREKGKGDGGNSFYFEKFQKDERGVTVVLGAVLVISIAVIAWDIFYPPYVKSSMKKKEASQMKEVRKQFLEMQSEVSWMEENESGTIRIPMSAGSVPLYPSKSPAGTLSVNSGYGSRVEEGDSGGGGITELVTNGTFTDGVSPWENIELVSNSNSEASISYDSTEGNGSIKTHILGDGGTLWNPGSTSEEKAYWYQAIGPTSDGTTITLNGAFKKSIIDGGGGIDNAEVRIEVKDGGSWMTILEDTTRSNMDWTNFPENTYIVQTGLDNIRCYMHARGTGGSWWNDTEADLWMDNISASISDGSGGISASENVIINPGCIRLRGWNRFYPSQTFAFEAGHVILEQDESDIMIFPKDSMMSWNADNYLLEIRYLLIAGENSSISSTGDRVVKITQEEDNITSENAENLIVFIETEYEKAWLSYLEDKAEEISGPSVKVGIDNRGRPYLNISSTEDVIKYSVKEDKIKAEIVNPP